MNDASRPIRIDIRIDRRSLKRLAWGVGTLALLASGVALAAPITFKDGDVLGAEQLNEIAAGIVPVGTIAAFGGTDAPSGWLLCDGASVLRSAYPALFAVIGTNWGAASGAPAGTSFNLPDLRGRFLRGVDSGATRDPDRAARTASQAGGNTGDKVGSVQGDEFKGHDHKLTDPGHSHDLRMRGPNASTTCLDAPNAYNGWQDSGSYVQPAFTGITMASTGGSETRPKNANVNFMIKF